MLKVPDKTRLLNSRYMLGLNTVAVFSKTFVALL